MCEKIAALVGYERCFEWNTFGLCKGLLAISMAGLLHCAYFLNGATSLMHSRRHIQ